MELFWNCENNMINTQALQAGRLHVLQNNANGRINPLEKGISKVGQPDTRLASRICDCNMQSDDIMKSPQ
jgi:hypothetical protein